MDNENNEKVNIDKDTSQKNESHSSEDVSDSVFASTTDKNDIKDDDINEDEEKKQHKKIILIILALIFAIIFIGCSTILFWFYKGCNPNLSKYIINENASSDSENTPEDGISLANNPIDFAKLKADNDDIIAWIRIPGSKVDYPVVRHPTEESFYLRRDYLGRYNICGCIFMQSVNKPDFTDPNTVLYGHYTYNGAFFGCLHSFRDPEYFKNVDTMFIYTDGHILTYNIFAAYEADSQHLLYSYDLSNKDAFMNYLEKCKNPPTDQKNIRENVDLNENSRIVTLSTCVQSCVADKRYLVQGVLIKDELTK